MKLKSILLTAFSIGSMYAASPSNYEATVLKDRPVVYYQLAELSGGTALDSSDNGHNGTYVGGVTFGQPGPLFIDPAASVAFDGNTGYIDSGFSPASLSATIEAWVRPFALSGSAGQEVLAGTSGSTQLTYGRTPGTSYAQFSIRNLNGGFTVLQTEAALPLNTWTHLVGTWNNATKQLSNYVNGVLNATESRPGPTPSNGGNLFEVGAFGNQSQQYFRGGLAEVAYYNQPLSAARSWNITTRGEAVTRWTYRP